MPLLFLSVLRASGGCTFADWQADAAAGCANYAHGTCQALARCGDAFLSPYGSYETCEVQLSQGCAYSLGLPDVFGSGEGAAVCGDMMLSVDCNAIINGELPAGCQTPSGKRSNGAPCQVGAQCASGRCAEFDGEWGVCRERVELGEACVVQADCGRGLVCSPAGRCVVLGRGGDACSVEHPCRAPLACVAGLCAAVDTAPTCQFFADMLCTQLAKCSESVVLSIYGDPRTCAARNAESCVSRLAMVEGTAAGAAIAGCTSALDAVSCQQLLDHALPAECQLFPGPRANGQPCSGDVQCASTRCAHGAATACSVCSPLGGIGDVCAADGDCSSGLICGGGSCRVPGVLGESCDTVQRCAYPWACAAGSCVEALGLGAPCSFAADSCSRYDGLFCGASSTCELWLVGAAGQPCNQTKGGWAACGGGASCIATAEGDTCLGPLADGSACNPDQGPRCLAPAQCLGGVCTLTNTVECL
jgi:hypothetical protein